MWRGIGPSSLQDFPTVVPVVLQVLPSPAPGSLSLDARQEGVCEWGLWLFRISRGGQAETGAERDVVTQKKQPSVNRNTYFVTCSTPGMEVADIRMGELIILRKSENLNLG